MLYMLDFHRHGNDGFSRGNDGIPGFPGYGQWHIRLQVFFKVMLGAQVLPKKLF